MKIFKFRTIIIFALVIATGIVLLNTSQNVQRAEEQLQQLQQVNAREEEKVRMLNAEWQALNNPERLEQLANEYLDLVPPTPEQMASESINSETIKGEQAKNDEVNLPRSTESNTAKKHNISATQAIKEEGAP